MSENACKSAVLAHSRVVQLLLRLAAAIARLHHRQRHIRCVRSDARLGAQRLILVIKVAQHADRLDDLIETRKAFNLGVEIVQRLALLRA